MRRRLVVSFVAALALAGCSGGDAAPGTVEMVEGQRFDPESVTVAPGTTLTFVNESSEAHTVTAYDGGVPDGAPYFSSGGFDSEDAARDSLGDALLAEGETYEVTLDEPGTYEYFCIPHEDQGMTGTIVVEG
ncbi:MAG TPA: plastocyanin/azurin family copper-binding protein [Actinomycetota bacterium]|nr:plastocyanin/azurin family copper-binding protein [Actinomycetota bacterium]